MHCNANKCFLSTQRFNFEKKRIFFSADLCSSIHLFHFSFMLTMCVCVYSFFLVIFLSFKINKREIIYYCFSDGFGFCFVLYVCACMHIRVILLLLVCLVLQNRIRLMKFIRWQRVSNTRCLLLIL